MHSLVYKKIQDAQARSKLANEMMIYHMQVGVLILSMVSFLYPKFKSSGTSKQICCCLAMAPLPLVIVVLAKYFFFSFMCQI